MATSGSWEVSWQSTYWSTPSNIKYYHWSGQWNKNGNTITLSNMQLWMSFTYPSGGTSVTDVVTVTGGSAQTVSFPDFSNTYSTGAAYISNTSFTVQPTATAYQISILISGENTGYATINFDPTYVAPTKPTISAVVSGTSVVLTYGTSSFGNPSTGTVNLLYGTTSSTVTTQLESKTTTGNSTYTHTGLTPNATYYYRVRATNGQLLSWSDTISVTITALPYYGSVNDKTKLIVKYYGSVNGQSKSIVKYYGSVGGKTKLLF